MSTLIDLDSYSKSLENYGITNKGSRAGIGNGVILNINNNPYNLTSKSLHSILSKMISLNSDTSLEEINKVKKEAIQYLDDLLNRLLFIRNQQQSLVDKLVDHFGSIENFEKYLNFRSGKNMEDKNTLIRQKENKKNMNEQEREENLNIIKNDIQKHYDTVISRLNSYKKIIAGINSALVKGQGTGTNKNIYDLIKNNLNVEKEELIYETVSFMGFLEESIERIKKYNINKAKKKEQQDILKKINAIHHSFKMLTKTLTTNSKNITSWQLDNALKNIEELEKLQQIFYYDSNFIKNNIDIDNLDLDILKKNQIKVKLDGLFKTASQRGFRNEAYQRAKDKIYFDIYFEGIDKELKNGDFIASVFNEKDFEVTKNMIVSYQEKYWELEVRNAQNKIEQLSFANQKELDTFLLKNPNIDILSKKENVKTGIHKAEDEKNKSWLNKVDNAVTINTEYGPITIAYSEKFAKGISDKHGIENLTIHGDKNLLNSLHLINPIREGDIQQNLFNSNLIGEDIIYSLLNFSKASKGYQGNNPQQIEKLTSYLQLFLLNNILDYMFNPAEFETNVFNKFQEAEEFATEASKNICYIFNATGRYAPSSTILNPIITTIQKIKQSFENIDLEVAQLGEIVKATIQLDTINTAEGLWGEVKEGYNQNPSGAWAYVAAQVMKNTEIDIKLNLVNLINFYE